MTREQAINSLELQWYSSYSGEVLEQAIHDGDFYQFIKKNPEWFELMIEVEMENENV